MAISLSRIFNRFTPTFSGNGITRLLEPLAIRQPVIYLGLVTLFAILGYLLLLLFPLIALSMLSDIPQQFHLATRWSDWLWLGVDVLIALAAAALSIPLFLNRFQLPQGPEINRDNAPKFCQLIEELRNEFKQPVVDRIILREGFAIDVSKTPRRNFPLLHSNTLIIGFDALICLPPEHFKLLLARRVGQLSGIHNRYIGWLAFLRQSWRQFHQAFKRQKMPLVWPMQFIFAIYAPFYEASAFYAARQNELEGDRYALDIADDGQVASLFSQLVITESFLKTRFWPKITQLAKRSHGQPEHLPYASMITVLRRSLTREDVQTWIKTAFDISSDPSNIRPLLRQRLENIGHHKPASPLPLKATASDKFIDPRVMEKIIQKFDQYWLAKIRK